MRTNVLKLLSMVPPKLNSQVERPTLFAEMLNSNRYRLLEVLADFLATLPEMTGSTPSQCGSAVVRSEVQTGQICITIDNRSIKTSFR